MKTLRELSLFTGGGIGVHAAHEAGISTVAMCESDEWCRYALERLWPGVPVFPDIRALTVDALPAGIDIISGGVPCQDISSAGKGVGITGERSALWFEMLRLVREVRPSWVLAENVPALRTRGADIVLDGLAEAGYAAWPVVVGAWACRAPHRRERVWIVGHADSNRAGDNAERVLRDCERIGASSHGGRANEQHGADRSGEDVAMRDESRWGPGEPSVRRREQHPARRSAGEDVADGAAIHEQRPERSRDCSRRSQAEAGDCCDVQDAPLLGCGPRWAESGGLGGPWRWPLGPGAEQHGWEFPRVVHRPTQPPVGGTTDGIPAAIPPAARRAALRILGNSWTPQIPFLIYRWILRQEGLA